MPAIELSKAALELSAEDRLNLARRLVESAVASESPNESIAKGVQRIEDIAVGRVKGLTEHEFRSRLAREKRR
ncbi:MAG: addiction module antitoxin RelB [Verrucomicrobiae bacterium]|nr:addiction module antitoxin RelB [Verrucomicrobiae bacterium]